MSQTTYNANRALAVPGLLYGNPEDSYVDGSFKAKEALEPGRLVVLDASTGDLRLPTTAAQAIAEPIVGVVVFQPTVQQTAIPAAGFTYPIGALVPVLRKGKVWAQVATSVAPTPLVAANVKHSSTVATDRGKVTTDAANATAGTEIDTPPNGAIKFIEKATTTLWAVELNLP